MQLVFDNDRNSA